MKIKLVLISVLIISSVSLISYQASYALFADSASSQNNTFTAADELPPPTSPLPTLPEDQTANHIVISEVQIATSGATTSDFVELYNPTSGNVNLNDFQLVKRVQAGTSSASLKVFSSSDVIRAHGFYLWASSDGEFDDQIEADASTGANITDDNSVALLDSSDVVVDAVAWGSGHTLPLVEGSPFATNPPDDQSIERKALSASDATSMTSGSDVNKGNGFDAGNNATDFILRTLSQPQNSASLVESL